MIHRQKRQTRQIHHDSPSSKRQKTAASGSALKPVNDLGILSPPVTPQKHNKTISIQTPQSPTDPYLTPSSHSSHSHSAIPTNLSSVSRRLNFSSIEKKSSPYAQAKQLFMRGSKGDFQEYDYILKGREKEATELKQLINNSLIDLESTSIYISGPPGSGKTAQVNAFLDSLTVQNIENHSSAHTHKVSLDDNINRSIRIAKINCMTLTKPEDIFTTIYRQILGKAPNPKQSIEDIRESLSNIAKTDMIFVVLDELDNIINKSQQTLFELFSWASNLSNSSSHKTHILLIGIANALDLTDRFLPRLRANRINPTLLQFLPYTADQIKQVITTKLQSLRTTITATGTTNSPFPPIVHPTAIQLCAKKSAVNTGDLRKAFDIIHRSIELTEEQTFKKLSIEQFNGLSIETAPKVMITQIAKVCSNAFNLNFNDKLKNLNLMQKTVLSCVLKYEEYIHFTQSQEKLKLKSRSPKKTSLKPLSKAPSTTENLQMPAAFKGIKLMKGDPSINQFYEFYTAQLQSLDKMISPLKRSEFLEVLGSLEANSLVNLSSMSKSKGYSSVKGINSCGKDTVTFGNNKVSSNVPKVELLKVIQDVGVLKKLMGDY